MSAVVCGKRHYFDDQSSVHHHHSPPAPPQPPSKRRRWTVEAPAAGAGVDRLVSLFPDIPREFLEKALEASGNDLNAAVKRLQESSIASTARTSENGLSGVSIPIVENLPTSGSEWVEVLVREMTNAGSINDFKGRASLVLEAFEKSIRSYVGVEATQSCQKETMVLKEQTEGLLRENSILKRAVAIQHERQKESNDRNQELQQLKQLVVQYQEQVKNLEMNNYTLSMHLSRAQQNTSMPGHFHPDIF